MRVEFADAFIKAGRKLSGKTLNSLQKLIQEVVDADSIRDVTNVKKLVGYDNIYRCRLGNLRSFFFYLDFDIEKKEKAEEPVVLFLFIVNRGEAYTKEMNLKLSKINMESVTATVYKLYKKREDEKKSDS